MTYDMLMRKSNAAANVRLDVSHPSQHETRRVQMYGIADHMVRYCFLYGLCACVAVGAAAAAA